MADILKDDVQTYVRELISEVFESSDKEDSASSDNRKSSEDDQRNQETRPG